MAGGAAERLADPVQKLSRYRRRRPPNLILHVAGHEFWTPPTQLIQRWEYRPGIACRTVADAKDILAELISDAGVQAVPSLGREH